MDPGRSAGDGALSAPGARADSELIRCPGPNDPLPRIDERLAPPETRLEYLDGIEMFAAPADGPHATRHFDVTRVLGAHVADGYRGAVDMLTRTGHTSDFAPDASIFPAAPDAPTGGRQLEELAFEVASEQSIAVPTEKARQLVRRGVRRVFCVLVGQRRALEWSRQSDGWRTMTETEVIQDRCLVRPLEIRALLDVAAADEAVAEALVARGAPAIERTRAQSEAKGHAEAKATAVLAVLAARGIELADQLRARVLSFSDSATLDRWLARAAVATSHEQVFGEP
ncbi:MAG: Uma2 family endonuclease [Deltaproteobacteria bacterium]|nr:Uma2 family endonuclease [Deltaproteobacteria bacterium]